MSNVGRGYLVRPVDGAWEVVGRGSCLSFPSGVEAVQAAQQLADRDRPAYLVVLSDTGEVVLSMLLAEDHTRVDGVRPAAE